MRIFATNKAETLQDTALKPSASLTAPAVRKLVTELIALKGKDDRHMDSDAAILHETRIAEIRSNIPKLREMNASEKKKKNTIRTKRSGAAQAGVLKLDDLCRQADGFLLENPEAISAQNFINFQQMAAPLFAKAKEDLKNANFSFAPQSPGGKAVAAFATLTNTRSDIYRSAQMQTNAAEDQTRTTIHVPNPNFVNSSLSIFAPSMSRIAQTGNARLRKLDAALQSASSAKWPKKFAKAVKEFSDDIGVSMRAETDASTDVSEKVYISRLERLHAAVPHMRNMNAVVETLNTRWPGSANTLLGPQVVQGIKEMALAYRMVLNNMGPETPKAIKDYNEAISISARVKSLVHDGNYRLNSIDDVRQNTSKANWPREFTKASKKFASKIGAAVRTEDGRVLTDVSRSSYITRLKRLREAVPHIKSMNTIIEKLEKKQPGSASGLLGDRLVYEIREMNDTYRAMNENMGTKAPLAIKDYVALEPQKSLDAPIPERSIFMKLNHEMSPTTARLKSTLSL